MHSRSRSLLRPALVRASLCAALAAIGVAATAADMSSPPPVVIDADAIVVDRTQVEWSEAYLQWIATFARGNSPVSDTTGAQCAVRQEGDVWFLATSDGTAPVERSCTIPAGKTLFVPIATTLERSGNKEPVCETMVRIAAGSLAHSTQLTMTVDGIAIDNLPSHRLATGDCFALGVRQVPRSTAKTAVADGYYVMLAPLTAGQHTLVVGGRYDNTTLSTTYRLDVH